MLLVINYYRLKYLQHKITKYRKKFQQQQNLEMMSLNNDVDNNNDDVTSSTRSEKYLKWREFGFLLSQMSYRIIYLCGLMLVIYVHGLQFGHLSGLTNKDFSDAGKSLFNPIIYAMFCIVTGAMGFIYLLVASTISVYFYCKLNCCVEEDETDDENDIIVTVPIGLENFRAASSETIM